MSFIVADDTQCSPSNGTACTCAAAAVATRLRSIAIERPGLRRAVGTPLLVLYGVGTIVGAGIYALVGEVAARAGTLAPLSFLIAAAMATASALSFAELSSRYPKSAGEAEFVAAAFGSRVFSALVGGSVIAIGVVSAATVANGFAGYAGEVLALPRSGLIVVFVAVVCAVAAWGIKESLVITGIMTAAEVGGLVLVIAYGAAACATGGGAVPEPMAHVDVAAGVDGVLAGALLAFFAYVGFEDMVNVAEEVRDAPRTLPRAIVITLVVTSCLYLVLSYLAVRIVPPSELGEAAAPLRLVYERSGGPWPRILNAIGVVAMGNGALVQAIMASRVAYGLAERRVLPGWIGVVATRTRTPVRATVAVSAVALLLALAFPLAALARATSLITLAVFAAVNLALVVVKRRGGRGESFFEVPSVVPWCGFVVSAVALVYGLSTLR